MSIASGGASVDVTVIGRANVDLVVRVPYRATPGLTVFGSELIVTPGGKALNQAIAVARLAGRVCLVANAGADAWGRMLVTSVSDIGVGVEHFHLVDGAPTGAAIIETTPDGENSIVLAVSPATELSGAQVAEAVTATRGRAVVVQLDMPSEPVAQALAGPRTGEVRIGTLVPHPCLDPALLADLDVLVVNQQEAVTILNATDVVPVAAAQALTRLGPPAAVVTAGAHGAAYCHADGSGTVPAPDVTVVDTTGAGDAFLGCLALELSRQTPFADAVACAVRVGSEAVQHQGAQLPALG